MAPSVWGPNYTKCVDSVVMVTGISEQHCFSICDICLGPVFRLSMYALTVVISSVYIYGAFAHFRVAR